MKAKPRIVLAALFMLMATLLSKAQNILSYGTWEIADTTDIPVISKGTHLRSIIIDTNEVMYHFEIKNGVITKYGTGYITYNDKDITFTVDWAVGCTKAVLAGYRFGLDIIDPNTMYLVIGNGYKYKYQRSVD